MFRAPSNLFQSSVGSGKFGWASSLLDSHREAIIWPEFHITSEFISGKVSIDSGRQKTI